tara:strand:- start:200 stop:388 length:189 start_codon:yes stop_codon:yes gene_type:complete
MLIDLLFKPSLDIRKLIIVTKENNITDATEIDKLKPEIFTVIIVIGARKYNKNNPLELIRRN